MNDHSESESWRERLTDALRVYGRAWAQEITTVARLIEFIQREPGCFLRSTREGHITGSAWLVDPKGTQVLLNHHRKLDKWLHVGGHADGNGNILEVALSEAREESGIQEIVPVSASIFDVDIHAIPARTNEPEHLHFDVRYALRALHQDHVVSHESHDLAWVRADAIESYTTEESMLRMSRKWLLMNPELIP